MRQTAPIPLAVAGVECSHRHDESCGGLEEQQEQSEEISVAPICSCDAKCTDAAVNEECDVCAADLTACEGNEPEQEETVLSEALQALQQRINALPTGEEYRAMTADGQEEVYGEAAELFEEYIALSEEEQNLIDITRLEDIFAVMSEGIEAYNTTGSGTMPGARSEYNEETGDVFLGGNYIEVGISKHGSFGTSTLPKTDKNWHPHNSATGLGLTSDGDGWDVGESPVTGDFFLPGRPEERWGLAYKLDDTAYQYLTADRVSVFSGSWSEEPTVEDQSDISNAKLKAVVTGTTTHGVKIKITYSFDVNDKFYTTKVDIENNSGQDISDVRFLRSFDPDQDQQTQGTFETYNKVICNPLSDKAGGGDNYAMVVARGKKTMAGFFFLAFDNRARASRGADFGPSDLYLYDLWDYAPETNLTYADTSGIALTSEMVQNNNINGYKLEDNAIALTFNLGALATDAKDSLEFMSSLDPNVEESLSTILDTGVDYEKDVLTGLEADTTYIITVGESQYTITANEKGEIPLSGTDKGGNPYDFAGKTLSVKKQGSEDTPAEIPVAPRPDEPDTPSDLEGTEGAGGTPAGDANIEIIELTSTSVTIRPKDGQQYAYSTDGEHWTTLTDTDEKGNYVISGLTEGATVSIRTRVPATSTTPASQWSESTAVTLKSTVVATATGWSGTYDGNNHPITVNVTSPAEGAVVTYSNTADGIYSAENPLCVSAGTYTVYYRVTAADYYPTYGSATVTIEKANVDAPIVQPADRTSTTVTVSEITPGFGAAQYAYNTVNTAPDTGWQTGTTFSGLEKNTTYYFFARYTGDDNHNPSPVSTGIAIRTLDIFTVTFDAKDGTLNDADNVQTKEGTKIAKPTDPSRSGYHFRGWFKDEALTQAWDFENDTVTADMTLYAGWKKKSSDSTLIGGGSTSTTPTKPETETKPDGTEITTVTKPDGTEITTETKADGTKTETVTKPDGTETTTETKPDGTKTETETKPDGTETTTVTDPDGGQKYTQEKNNGVAVEAEVTTDGKVTGSISVPSSAEGEMNWIAIPAGDGNVVIRTLPDGTQKPVEFGVVIDGMAYVLARESADIHIETRVGLFDDMTAHWAEEPTDFTGGREIFKGTDYRTFSPEKTLTRGMMVAVLYRMEQEPAAAPHTFNDVNEKKYYNPAIAWAAETGVAKGYDEFTFGAEDVITREQMAVMMFKYAKACDYDLSTGKEMTFADEASISPWAKEAMDWAVSTGILSGRTGGIADPQGATTRAEASAIMERFIRNVVGKQS